MTSERRLPTVDGEARPPPPHERDDSAVARLVVDPASGRVFEASAAAALLLGLPHPVPASAVLDRAMPALETLRTFDGTDAGASLDLLLWTPAGAVRHTCRCRRVSGPAGQSPVCLEIGGVADAPSAAQDDLAVLARIARRIREGARGGLALDDLAPRPPPAAEPARMARPEPSRPPQASGALPGPDAAGRPGGPHAGPPRLPPEVEAALARLAHEIKTPLSAIATLAEVLRDERFGPLSSPRYVEYARAIHTSAQHALAVVDGMLDGRAVCEGAPAAEFAQIDLNDVAADCVASLAPVARERGLELSLDTGDRLPHVIADRRAVSQILINLVSNAMKFTPEGGRIAVTTRYEIDGLVRLMVADSGGGMPASQIKQLLADGSAAAAPASPGLRARPGGGHGLGLPIVQALVHANGAALEIDSAPGRGTRMTVRFARDRVVPV